MKTNLTLLVCSALLSAGPVLAAPPVINAFTPDDPTLYFGGLPSFEWDITGAVNGSISPGIAPLPYLPAGSAATTAIVGKAPVIPRGATWKYLDTGADLGASDQAYTATAWFHPDFDDTAWRSGVAELGYGDGPATVLRYGADDDNLNNDANNKFLTYYFRHEFSVTQPDIDRMAALFLELERDDGAIVYLNGTKIARMQMPADPVNFNTVAEGDTGGGEESFYFRCAVDKSLLLPGNNVIAVEVHQRTVESSDVSFDMELYAIRATDTVELLPLRSTWRYLDDGSDGNAGATDWNETAYNDNGWKSGAAPAGFDTARAFTLVNYGTDPALKPVTAYFRKKFNVADKSALQALSLRYNIDDGMVIYLNGKEVTRKFLPVSPAVITATTAATSHNTGTFNVLEPALPGEDVSASLTDLVDGENTLAVEVHQAGRTSSDLNFNLVLHGTTATGTTLLVPGWTEWKYFENLDNAGLGSSDQANTASAWFNPAFDDSAWLTGRGIFAYNSGTAPATQTVSTVVNVGGELDGRFVTTYFRREFSVTADQLSALESLSIQLTRDDAAAVYINGVEVGRENLPAAAVEAELGYQTLATAAANGTVTMTVPKASANLIEGTNLIAVEVHQSSLTSSDLLFDLAMFGNVSGTTRSYTLAAGNVDGTSSQTVNLNLGAVPAGAADPVTLMQSEEAAAAVIDWQTPELWSDRLLPDSAKPVTIYGNFARVLRTPAVASPVWPGGRLTLQGFRSRYVLHQNANTVATVADLVLKGGQLQSGIAGTAAATGVPAVTQTRRIEGMITVDGRGVLNPGANDAILDVGSTIVGTGTLVVTGSAGTAAVALSGDNSANFSGNILVQRALSGGTRGSLLIRNSRALGTNNTLTIEDGARVAPDTAAPDALFTDLVIPGTGRYFLALGSTFRSVTVGGVPLANGTYTFATLPATMQANFPDSGGGTISVGVANPDADRDGMLDVWEITHFGSTAALPGDDPDGDGATNLSEFLAGTVPTDIADVFAIASVTPNATASQFTVAWPAKAGKTYTVRFSDGLDAWTAVNASTVQAAANGTLTWTDDGSLTGGLPANGRRFYEVIIP